jgi:hypothetical protein
MYLAFLQGDEHGQAQKEKVIFLPDAFRKGKYRKAGDLRLLFSF